MSPFSVVNSVFALDVLVPSTEASWRTRNRQDPGLRLRLRSSGGLLRRQVPAASQNMALFMVLARPTEVMPTCVCPAHLQGRAPLHPARAGAHQAHAGKAGVQRRDPSRPGNCRCTRTTSEHALLSLLLVTRGMFWPRAGRARSEAMPASRRLRRCPPPVRESGYGQHHTNMPPYVAASISASPCRL